jgi:hypothetical protein
MIPESFIGMINPLVAALHGAARRVPPPSVYGENPAAELNPLVKECKVV